MNKKKGNTGKIIVLIILIGAVVTAVYYQLSDKAGNNKDSQTEISEAETLIGKDLTNAYPDTPKEVVKLYSRITQCIYNAEYEEEDFEKLIDQLRLLYDEELLAGNSKETQSAALEAEIAEYKSTNTRITSYQVTDDEVVYNEIEGREYCELTSAFFSKQGKTYLKTYEDFVLRKDESGNWKVFGWKKAEMEEEVDAAAAETSESQQ